MCVRVCVSVSVRVLVCLCVCVRWSHFVSGLSDGLERERGREGESRCGLKGG